MTPKSPGATGRLAPAVVAGYQTFAPNERPDAVTVMSVVPTA
jgi:hypothetical protein